MNKKHEAAIEAQQYTPKFQAGVCRNCTHRVVTLVLPDWMRGKTRYTLEKHGQESNSCGIGSFPVKKLGICRKHTFVGERCKRITFELIGMTRPYWSIERGVRRPVNEAKETTMDDKLACPECGSEKVALTAEQMFMANTGEHYCHSVKTQDDEARATCLGCQWTGHRGALVASRKTPNVRANRPDTAEKEQR